jgi:HYR domain-containing protein/beta-propeller repeat-containing protein
MDYYRIGLRHILLSLPFLIGFCAFAQSSGVQPKVIFSTFLGGTGFDAVNGVATDPNGNVYVTGVTSSPSFPGVNVPLSGSCAAFLAKFTADGHLVFDMLFGGSGCDEGDGIAVDAAGDTYIAGATTSTDLPIVNGFQTTYPGGPFGGFVAKVDPSGNLLYSTYLGPSQAGRRIAIDSSGNAYVVGGENTATPNVLGGFALKINPNAAGASSLVYSVHFGNAFSSTYSNAIALDSMGNAYVGGSFGGVASVSEVSPTGTVINGATLGNTGSQTIDSIAVDKSGNLYVTGQVNSLDFPTTANAIQTVQSGAANAFVSELQLASGHIGQMTLIYSTYLGGNYLDAGTGITLDGSGHIYVSGWTGSSNFPTQNPLQSSVGTTTGLAAFLVQIDPTLAGTAGLTFGTYYGNGFQGTGGVSLAPTGRLAFVGYTSGGIPIVNAFQPSPGGPFDGFDGFVANIAFPIAPPQLVLPGPITAEATGPNGATVTYSVTATDDFDPNPSVSCLPATGTVFPLGSTTVNCTATDAAGNSSTGSFIVRVVDTTPPNISVPANATIDATSPAGAVFTFSISAVDLVDLHPTVNCTAASGSTFAIGTTTDTCIATDFSGNKSSGSFQITVEGAAQQISDLMNYVAGAGLDSPLTNSLESKLSAAFKDGFPGSCGDLTDFITEVGGQSGKKIPVSVANQLIASAQQIKNVLGCK